MTLYAEHLPRCAFCDKEVNPNAKNVYYWTQGWRKNRSGGEGTQALRGEIRSPEFAHALCLDVKLAGEDPKEMYAKGSLL